MPAAAVIPAPIAYIKVVAVKKLVVGFLVWCAWPATVRCVSADARLPSCRLENVPALDWVGFAIQNFYFEKIRVFKAGVFAMNTLAWNNNLGLESYFVGF